MNATLTPGTELVKQFSLFNPYSESVRVLEVYTAEDAFRMSLPDGECPAVRGEGASEGAWRQGKDLGVVHRH